MGNPVAWLLVFHLSGMVVWLGGLFLALAAAGAVVAGDAGDAAALRQRAALAQRGLRRLAHPGAALMVITGALLFWQLPYVRTAGWMHAKLTLVLILIVLDLMLTVRLRRQGGERLSRGEFAMYHTGIGAVVFLILVLVLVKPF